MLPENSSAPGAGKRADASRLPRPPRYAPTTPMHLLRVSVERGLQANCAISVFLYLIVTIAGAVWGVTAVDCLFKIEVELRGQGVGLVAAGLLPLFMTPWAIPAVWVAMRILDDWIEVLSSGRDR